MSATALPLLQVWLPAPSWANHNAIFSAVGLEVGAYSYYDKATCGFDFEGAKADIKVSMNKMGCGTDILALKQERRKFRCCRDVENSCRSFSSQCCQAAAGRSPNRLERKTSILNF